MTNKPKVILFGNKKGGVGKTTYTIHTAGILAHYGHRVLVIDQDTQQSVYQNYKRRAKDGNQKPTFDYHYQVEPLSHDVIESLGTNYDFILIDSPPGTEDASTGKIQIRKSTPHGFLVSDLVVIPFGMGSSDIDSGLSYANYFRRHHKRQIELSGKAPSAIVVPNLLVLGRSWSPIYSGLQSVIQKWADSGVSLSEIIIWNYADYNRPQFSGMTAADLPRSKPRMLFEKLVFEKFCVPLGVTDPRPKEEKIMADAMVAKTWMEAKGKYAEA